MFKKAILALFVAVLLSFLPAVALAQCDDCEQGTRRVVEEEGVVIEGTWSFEGSGVVMMTRLDYDPYGNRTEWRRGIYCPDGSAVGWEMSMSAHVVQEAISYMYAIESVTLMSTEEGDRLLWEQNGKEYNKNATCSDMPPEQGVLVVDTEQEQVWVFSGVEMVITFDSQRDYPYQRVIYCGDEAVDVYSRRYGSLSLGEVGLVEAIYRQSGRIEYTRRDGISSRTISVCLNR